MWMAWLLTLLALMGAWAGASFGHKTNQFSEHLAAAGGGLLFGIALFWLVPEIGETAGLRDAILLTLGVAFVFALLDFILTHAGHSVRHGAVWPLLLATAIHSLLDGWSIRQFSVQPLTNIAVVVGLALHKIPEGAALGWITRRSLHTTRRALAASAGAELFTLAGAFAEPSLNASGAGRFGMWWSPAVLAVIAGGFLFLGFHSILPLWKRRDLMAIFFTTLLLAGALTFLKFGGI
jgi:zinc transporter ZupT